MPNAIEPGNNVIFDELARKGPIQFGPMISYSWRRDPKHLLFHLARYKFAAKLCAGRERLLEVGCGDGIGIPLLLQSVVHVIASDREPQMLQHLHVDDVFGGRYTPLLNDMLEAPVAPPADCAVSLDVLEHIPTAQEQQFVGNIARSLTPAGLCVIGTPNITSEAYAGALSRSTHVNLKSADALRALLADSFTTTLIFSMNDEIVHTGFFPMAHYLFGVGIGVKTV